MITSRLGKNIKVLVVATALLGSASLYAKHHGGDGYDRDCDRDDKRCEKRDDRKECYGKKFYKHNGYKGDRQYRSHHKGDISRFFIGAIYSLDLTKDQQAKIDKLIKEFQEKRMNKFDIFSEDKFDKEAYIKSRLNMKEDMVRARADLIESIHKVLTKEQKKELKEEIEDFKKMRQKKFERYNR
jgi:Spy/CpxP family protein refolding chaperone